MRIVRLLQHTMLLAAAVVACSPSGESGAAASGATGGQASVADNESQQDIVRIAVGSKDHTTLVAALKAADLVNSLANAGPFTVFAPTNAAFDKLPPSTVSDLLKPANKSTLAGVLTHHVTTSALELSFFTDGQMVGMADGGSEKITKKGADTFIGGAKVVGSVRGSNGWVHVIDAVLVPASK